MSSEDTLLPAFDPPGFPYVDELTPENKKIWSEDMVSAWMQLEITAKDEDGNDISGPYDTKRTPLTHFFNGTKTPYNMNQTPIAIHWTAFPNTINVKFTKAQPLRWKIADASRDFQDEYLEWSLKKDDSGNITNIVYTCEGPEYWQFLADNQRDKLLELYKTLNPGLTDDDVQQIFITDPASGVQVYNPENYLNKFTFTGTIAHLTHQANTLGAEVDIASQATVVRKDLHGKVITDEQQLIHCSLYGSPDRNSDPHIGGSINRAVQAGSHISINNPVALYMYSFDRSSFMLDIEGTGNNMVPVPEGTFTFTRGNIDKNMGLRLAVQVPMGVVGKGKDNKGRQMTVSDIVDTNNSENILYGAQFADYIQMSVSGVTGSKQSQAEPQPCPGPQPSGASLTLQSMRANKSKNKRFGVSRLT